LQLWLVGKDFSQSKEWETKLTCSGIRQNIELIGYVNDETLRHLFRRASMLVHLSKNEGFGFTPLESLRMGTPVVVADIPVMREVLKGWATYVEPSEVASVAGGIDSILRTPLSSEEQQAMIAYTNNFRWKEVAKQYVDIYSTLINATV
jgi:glycosyltransferase involved in cell wall biosynthesis